METSVDVELLGKMVYAFNIWGDTSQLPSKLCINLYYIYISMRLHASIILPETLCIIKFLIQKIKYCVLNCISFIGGAILSVLNLEIILS